MGVIKLVAPNTGKADRVYCFPINSFCETSHNGVKMTFNYIENSF